MTWRIKLYRSSQDNHLYFLEPFTKRQAWQDLLLTANHKDWKIIVRWNIIDIKRWQNWYSEGTLAKRWKWSRNKVRRYLNYLETIQQIEQQKSKVKSTITLINYDKYQTNDTTDDTTERHQTIQQTDTNKNDKKNKEIKYIYISEKKQISELLEKEYIQNWKWWLKVMWELFIEKWYNIEAKQKSIIDFIDWLKKKSKTTFGTSQQGDYLWDKTYNAIEDCMEYHKQDRTMIVKQTHKSRVNTWFANKQNGFNNKK